MLGPTINMAQEDPSKAAVFLERTVRASKHNHIMHLKKVTEGFTNLSH